MDAFKKLVLQQALRFVARKVIAALLPFALPVLVVLFLALCLQSMLFDTPIFYQEKTGHLGFFSSGIDAKWTIEQDKHLGSRYRSLVEAGLGSKEAQPFTPSQYEQASTYRLSWAVLAAIDRVLGDPIMNDKVNRKPNPERNYEALKPVFIWRDSTVTVKKTIVNEKQEKVEVTESHTVKLLDQVDAYNGKHTFSYRWVETKEGNAMIRHEVLDNEEIQFYDESENRLTRLLRSHGLPANDILLVRELAITYSDDPSREETEFLLYKLASRPGQGGGGGGGTTHPPGGWKGRFPLAGEPGAGFIITSWFGYRDDPFTGHKAYHDGMDLAAPKGTPVFAPLDGVVQYAASMSGYGNTVMLGHGNVLTLYGHMDVVLVKSGQRVKKGDLIGKVGSTGRSTGPHLHWGAYSTSFSKANAFDPMQLMK